MVIYNLSVCGCCVSVLRACDVVVVRALYQTGPPCNCDLRSICNLSPPEAAAPVWSGRVQWLLYSPSVSLFGTSKTFYITALRRPFDLPCREMRGGHREDWRPPNDPSLFPLSYKGEISIMSVSCSIEVFPPCKSQYHRLFILFNCKLTSLFLYIWSSGLLDVDLVVLSFNL